MGGAWEDLKVKCYKWKCSRILEERVGGRGVHAKKMRIQFPVLLPSEKSCFLFSLAKRQKQHFLNSVFLLPWKETHCHTNLIFIFWWIKEWWNWLNFFSGSLISWLEKFMYLLCVLLDKGPVEIETKSCIFHFWFCLGNALAIKPRIYTYILSLGCVFKCLCALPTTIQIVTRPTSERVTHIVSTIQVSELFQHEGSPTGYW